MGVSVESSVAYGYFADVSSRTSVSDGKSIPRIDTNNANIALYTSARRLSELRWRGNITADLGWTRLRSCFARCGPASLSFSCSHRAGCPLRSMVMQTALECSSLRAIKSIWSWILMFGVRHLGCHMCSAPSSPRLDVNTNSLLSPCFL
jgi:hypothetical protein